jgi:glycosyltransferase involved in cell wall biosynthesis
VDHDFSCYHIDDEYTFSESDVAMTDAENALIHEVDLVLAQSRPLLEKKAALNPASLFVPNGVDYEAFSTRSDMPSDLIKVPRPIIGYAGYLKQQLDWPLLLHLAREHPEWSFVFVGPRAPQEDVRVMVERIGELPNVYLLGPKPVKELARYPQHFDVCIMPYRPVFYTIYGYPLKLHEYLASGSPTVGTRIPSIEEFRSVVEVVTTPSEWSEAIARSLAPDARAPEAQQARRRVAREHDWGSVVATIAGAIVRGVHHDST